MTDDVQPSPPYQLQARVPASTSNLGPGFDQLGLALALHLHVTLAGPAPGDAHELLLEGEIAEQWPRENNRLLVAFDALLAGTDLAQNHYRFRVHSDIPLCRGLGSSGAATAAGLVLAAGLCNTPENTLIPRERAADLGVQIEGHPDNVIASLYGGCTLGVVLEGGKTRVIQQELNEQLVFAVAWPSTPLDTNEARAAMPASLPLEDVVWSTRRLSLLLAGLRSADPELLRHGVDDRLHTPYRLPLIAGAREALQAAQEAGAFCAAISGSGSALVALHTDNERAEDIARAMQSSFQAHHTWAKRAVLQPDFKGARLI